MGIAFTGEPVVSRKRHVGDADRFVPRPRAKPTPRTEGFTEVKLANMTIDGERNRGSQGAGIQIMRLHLDHRAIEKLPTTTFER
jgi:hypothetical protein